MNVDKLTDVVLAQMGWSKSMGDYDGIRSTVRVAIKATLALSPVDDEDRRDVSAIVTDYND